MPISDKKVLLLNVNREGWHSGNMIYDMRCIQEACDTVIYGPGWPNYENTDLDKIIKQVYGDDKPDIVYSYFTPDEKVGQIYIDHYKIPSHLHHFPTNFQNTKGVIKVFGLSDFWARKPQQFSRDLDRSSFDHCFCCFTPPYSNSRHFYAFFDENIRKKIKFHSHPRCVDPNCYKDYGLPKKHDIITAGAMWGFYPFRCNMHQQLSGNAEKMGINYHRYGHCGTNFSHNGFVRDKYAQAINESKMLASCGGKYSLAFNKIFEAMGCNTLYVGEKPYGEKELGLKDEYNYVAVTPDNFLEKVKYYLDNEDDMKRIVKNANDTFLERHTITARAHDFAKLIESL